MVTQWRIVSGIWLKVDEKDVALLQFCEQFRFLGPVRLCVRKQGPYDPSEEVVVFPNALKIEVAIQILWWRLGDQQKVDTLGLVFLSRLLSAPAGCLRSGRTPPSCRPPTGSSSTWSTRGPRKRLAAWPALTRKYGELIRRLGVPKRP